MSPNYFSQTQLLSYLVEPHAVDMSAVHFSWLVGGILVSATVDDKQHVLGHAAIGIDESRDPNKREPTYLRNGYAVLGDWVIVRSPQTHCFGSSHNFLFLALPHPFHPPAHPRDGQRPQVDP